SAEALSLDRFLRLLDTLRPRALRVVRARLEQAEPAAALDQWLAADRALLVQDLRALARLAVLAHVRAVLALRVARAAHEGPEAARLVDQVALVAQRALLVGVGRRRLLSRAEHPLQRAVEVLDHRHPLALTALDLVEPLLERGRVVVVGDRL